MRWKEKLTEPFDLYGVSMIRPYLMGIAALWVTMYHCKYLNLFNSAILTGTRLLGLVTRVEAIGNCAVDLFFFLSGLGLYFSYTRSLEKDPHPTRSFYGRRYRRILPTVLTVTVLTYGLMGEEGLAEWAGDVFLYCFWLPSMGRGNFWYFSATVVLYLIYPLIHRVIRGKRETAGAAGLILASVGLAYLIRRVDEAYFYSHLILVLTRLPVFIMGAWTGKLCLRHRKIPALVPILSIPVGILLVILINDRPQLFPDETRFYAYALLVPCIVLGHAYVFSKIRRRGFLYRTVALIGAYSMEIYLLFESVYNHAEHLFDSPEGTGVVYALTCFTATLMLAVLLKTAMDRLTRDFDSIGAKAAGKKEGAGA